MKKILFILFLFIVILNSNATVRYVLNGDADTQYNVYVTIDNVKTTITQVNPGADSGNGDDPLTAWNSIAYAITNSTAGDTIFVFDYNDSYYQTSILSVSKTLSLQSNFAILTFNSVYLSLASNYTQLKGFRIINSTGTVAATRSLICFSDGTNHHLLENCYIENNNITATTGGLIGLQYSSNNATYITIKNNIIKNNTLTNGIFFIFIGYTAPKESYLINNSIFNNSATNISSEFIAVFATNAYYENNVFEYNIFNGAKNFYSSTGNDTNNIYYKNTNENNVYTNNVLEDALLLTDGTDTFFINNNYSETIGISIDNIPFFISNLTYSDSIKALLITSNKTNNIDSSTEIILDIYNIDGVNTTTAILGNSFYFENDTKYQILYSEDIDTSICNNIIYNTTVIFTDSPTIIGQFAYASQTTDTPVITTKLNGSSYMVGDAINITAPAYKGFDYVRLRVFISTNLTTPVIDSEIYNLNGSVSDISGSISTSGTYYYTLQPIKKQ